MSRLAGPEIRVRDTCARRQLFGIKQGRRKIVYVARCNRRFCFIEPPTEGFNLRGVELGLSLKQPESITQYFTRVLVAA